MLFEYGSVRAVQILFPSHIVPAEIKIVFLIFTSFLNEVRVSMCKLLFRWHNQQEGSKVFNKFLRKIYFFHT